MLLLPLLRKPHKSDNVKEERKRLEKERAVQERIAKEAEDMRLVEEVTLQALEVLLRLHVSSRRFLSLDAIAIEPLEIASLHLMRGGLGRYRMSSAAIPPAHRPSIGFAFCLVHRRRNTCKVVRPPCLLPYSHPPCQSFFFRAVNWLTHDKSLPASSSLACPLLMTTLSSRASSCRPVPLRHCNYSCRNHWPPASNQRHYLLLLFRWQQFSSLLLSCIL